MGVTTSSSSAATYTAIATQTLASPAATVTFSSIPSTYTDLVLVTGDILNTTNILAMYMQFNGDTGSHYSDTLYEGNGSSTGAGRDSNKTALLIGRSYGGDKTMNVYQIYNYANTTTYKTTLCRYSGGYTSSAVGAGVGLWKGSTGSSTEAITSITIGLEGGYNFSANGSFTLYGIKAA